MWGAIGGFFGRLLGTEKSLSRVVGAGVDALDKIWYTSEEKADHQERLGVMLIEWVKNTSGQNLARRIIALLIVAMWLFERSTALILNAVAVWMPSKPKTIGLLTDVNYEPGVSEKMIASAKYIATSADQMQGAVMLILAFYFAAPHMGGIVKGAIEKFKGNNT